MLDKVDFDVGYELQGVYKKKIDNYLKIRVYINAKLFCTSSGIPPASSVLVATLKNHTIQDLWCQPP